MRPNHQNNKRMRGRNRGGKGPNPLSRSYESNGPDVKVRGTAQHIAEKYLQLARDAQASGDPVTAENYLQHAEHYLRLIAAAQEQFRQQNPHYRPYEAGGEEGDEGDDDGQAYGAGPQPDVRFPAAAVDGEMGEGYQPREFQPRQRDRDFQPRQRDRDFQPRENREFQPREGRDFQPREGREFQPRENRDFQPRDQQPREPREFQPRPEGGSDQPRENREFQPREGREFQGRRDDRFQRRPRFERPAPEAAEAAPAGGLPAFITAPVRQAVPVAEAAAEPVAPSAPAAGPEGEGGQFPLRTRRRRRSRSEGGEPVTDEAPAGE